MLKVEPTVYGFITENSFFFPIDTNWVTINPAKNVNVPLPLMPGRDYTIFMPFERVTVSD